MANEIQSPHDRYFKAMLSNKEVAQDFLDWHLPPFIKKQVDLEMLNITLLVALSNTISSLLSFSSIIVSSIFFLTSSTFL
jgi:hypothetical protein